MPIRLAGIAKQFLTEKTVVTIGKEEDPIPNRFVKIVGGKPYVLAAVIDELESDTDRSKKPLWFMNLASKKAFGQERGPAYDNKTKMTSGGKVYYPLLGKFRIR